MQTFEDFLRAKLVTASAGSKATATLRQVCEAMEGFGDAMREKDIEAAKAKAAP